MFFYVLSTDYLLCRTELREHTNKSVSDLHLNDDAVQILTDFYVHVVRFSKEDNRCLYDRNLQVSAICYMRVADNFFDRKMDGEVLWQKIKRKKSMLQ